MTSMHGNHRIGDCPECFDAALESHQPASLRVSHNPGTLTRFVPGGVVTISSTVPLVDATSYGGRLEPMSDPYRKRPAMPQLWRDEGDDS